MKNIFYFILVMLVFAGTSCKRNPDPFGFYRPSHANNFITVRGGELYAYCAEDSVVARADYFIKMLGQVRIYGSEVLHYGHVWHPTNTNPVIGIDTLMTYDPLDAVFTDDDTLAFTSTLTRLKANTVYYIRSYVITGDGTGNPVDTGYNQVTRIIRTKDAIDEWFARELKPTGKRFDAVAFNFGDTVFFGTGNQGYQQLTKDIAMYDPETDSWTDNYVSLVSVQLPLGTKPWKEKVTDAVGFAIAFKDRNVGANPPVNRCIYVGLGDFGGFDNNIDKSDKLLEYNLDKGTWRETAQFTGGTRSGAVAFVIDGRAYVGTGSNNYPVPDWHVYDPALDRDQDPITPAWRSFGGNVPSTKGRIGAIAFVLNGRGYFGLGRDEDGNFLKDFYRFTPNSANPVLGTWLRMADFPGAPRANAVAFALGDQGYVGTGDNIIGDMESHPPTYTGEVFEDFYRYDPFNNRWYPVRDYTSDKKDRIDLYKKVTRGVGFSIEGDNVGFAGYGLVPEPYPGFDPDRAQDDLWMYRPYELGGKK